MVHFIRDGANNTLVDLEVFRNEDNMADLSVTIPIADYTLFVRRNFDKVLQIAKDFNDIQDLRSWLWEIYYQHNNIVTIKDVNEEISESMRYIADKYDLNYVVD